jgi:hypothetical protein
LELLEQIIFYRFLEETALEAWTSDGAWGFLLPVMPRDSTDWCVLSKKLVIYAV